MSSKCGTRARATETESPQCECEYRPDVDVCERAEEVVILADLPGAAPDSIEVDYEDGELSIQAAVKPRQGPDTRYLVREYGVGDFCRKFRVSEIVDAEQISAGYSNGVLTVRLPKVKAAKPRRIVVSSN